jgi:streptogramin lyase
VVPYPGAALAYAFDHLWTISGGRLLRINPRDASVRVFNLPGGETGALLSDADRYRGIAAGEGAIWLADVGLSKLLKLDPVSGAVRLIVPTDIFGSAGSIGVGEGSVWILTFDSRDRTLVRYDAGTGYRQAAVALPEPGVGVLVAEGSVWVTAASRPELYRIDPRTDSVVATIALLAPSRSLATTPGEVWVSFDVAGTVQRIDAKTGVVEATIETGVRDMETDGDIAADAVAVWTVNRNSAVARIDIDTDAVTGTFVPPVGTVMGRRLRIVDGAVWITGPSTFRARPPDG